MNERKAQPRQLFTESGVQRLPAAATFQLKAGGGTARLP